MKLTIWTYEGPPHVGAMRVATAMKGLHYVLHAPQGDTYADLLFTMIERRDQRPPVTYTTFKARDLGGDTATLLQDAMQDAYDRFQPTAMIVGASCTAELLQDDPGGLVTALNLPVPVIPLELPSYQRKENFGASETLYHIVRALCPVKQNQNSSTPTSPTVPKQPSCNLLGPTALGFRHRDDTTEIKRLMESLGIKVNVTAPYDATPEDITRLAEADFNVVMYPETALTAAKWLEKNHGQPYTKTVPIGVGATREFIAEVTELAGLNTPVAASVDSRMPWYSRSIDSNYLTGKRVYCFGDATHVLAAARVATEEMGFEVVGLGTYSREFARDVREAGEQLGVPVLITDDYLDVEQAVIELQPELILGTQMERHIAKRQRIPCAVISAPVHVQDFPARYSPQMGFEGANVLFDTWVHPLMMGLEEHLLTMFRDDFEFHDGAGSSHLHGGSSKPGVSSNSQDIEPTEPAVATETLVTVDGQVGKAAANSPVWHPEAEKELRKIPFFVRGKARRNTERFAAERGLTNINLDTLYDAKAHFGR